MNRRAWTLTVGIVPILVLVFLAVFVPVPYVALGPGPTFNTLGKNSKGQGVVVITGTEVYPTTGHLNMTTVSVDTHLSLVSALSAWLSDRQQVVPIDEIYPPNVPHKQIDEQNRTQFVDSGLSAEAAALNYLHIPQVVSVENVVPKGPSDGHLKPGDVIVSINTAKIITPADVTKYVGTLRPGRTVDVTVKRGGDTLVVPVTLGARGKDSSKPLLGVVVGTTPADPHLKFSFDLADIGGPSAGLMFALAVVDKLSPGQLTGGKFIAGTGEIAPDGQVGPIGGITHKMLAAREAGATVFLVPAPNCTEAKSDTPQGLKLIKVTSLSDAVTDLNNLNSGKAVPGC